MTRSPTFVQGVIALAGVAGFLAVVIPLHFLQPGYDPAQQLMSELALGPYGEVMVLAFTGIAGALAAVVAALGRLGAGWPVRALLGLASIGFALSGAFPLGAASTVHIAAIASAFVTAVLAMYLFPSMAGPAAWVAPRALSWSLAAGVAAAVALGQSVLPMGVGQRLAAACLFAWIACVGWRLARGRSP